MEAIKPKVANLKSAIEAMCEYSHAPQNNLSSQNQDLTNTLQEHNQSVTNQNEVPDMLQFIHQYILEMFSHNDLIIFKITIAPVLGDRKFQVSEDETTYDKCFDASDNFMREYRVKVKGKYKLVFVIPGVVDGITYVVAVFNEPKGTPIYGLPTEY
jgi:hypothetical protein